MQNTLSWINTVLSMGGEAQAAIDLPQAARFLGEAMGVPSDLIIKKDRTLADDLAEIKPALDALTPQPQQESQQGTKTGAEIEQDKEEINKEIPSAPQQKEDIT